MDQAPCNQEPQSDLPDDELNALVAEIKDRLRKATETNAVQQQQDHPPRDGTYIVNESDIHGLLYYILDVMKQLRTRRESNGTAITDTVVGPSFSPAPRSLRPAASPTVDPATTLTVPEATFTPATGVDDGGQQRAAQTATTTTTMVSRDNITSITWLKPMESTPALRSGHEADSKSPSSPGTPNMTDQAQMARAASTVDRPVLSQPDNHTSSDSDSHATVDFNKPRPLTRVNTRKKRQESIIVSMGSDEAASEEGLQTGEGSDQPKTVLGKMRKKSIQLGQAMGSFINGAYRNADHKPRRESSEWSSGRNARVDSMLMAYGRCCTHERYLGQTPAF